MDARRVALARRRHTIFISSDNQNKTIGPVQSDRGGIVKIKAEKSDTSVRKTQSMPQIVEDGSSQGKGIPSVSESGGSGGSKDFTCAMEEVKRLREQLLAFHKQQSEDEFQEELETKKELGSDEEEDGGTEEIQPLEGSMLATSGAFTSRKLQRQAMRAGRRAGGTGRKATGRVRALRRTRSAQIRAQQARETLSQPPRTLTRTTSYPLLKDELINNTFPAPSNDYRRSRRESLPSSLTDVHFQSLKHHIETTDPIVSTTQASDMTTSDASYQWALQLWWDRWFPEVLQEYKQIVAAYSVGKNAVHTFGIGEAMSRHFGSTVAAHKVKSNIGQETKEKDAAPSLDSATPQLVRLVNIDPLSSLSADQVKQIEAEIMKLTKSMPKCRDGSMRAVLLCRRGALLRKIGRLRDSMSDLKSALSLQPTLSDSLWHRHLLHLIQGNEQLALDDLNSLLKCNKKHFGAYRSRMVLLLRRGDTSKAVFNLTQAIALQPKDAEMYFMRAELFEKRGEVESALSDYAKVTELQPKNKEAISRQAMHKFKKGMWGAATQHFNALLQLDPNNTQARIHRAKAQYNLGRYVAALQDLSASIHLDPNGAQAFYHRACLLRKSQPKKALSDLSISLLLDDSATNVSAYIHRGILYTQLNSYNEALSDFEEAIKLHRSLPAPHICAGLIHMLHKKNLPRAVRCFTTAISVDPTCTRAYLCRAEAFKASEMFERAILDCTRLIHLQPNNPTYYLRMGELYLSLKNYKMAAQLIRTAAKLCHSGFNQSKTQQALVESFLGNHAEGVALLQTMLRSPSVFTLMGKIQFKAKQFEEAANSFKQAITLVERSLQPKYMVTHMSELDLPKSAVSRKVRGDIHFQCGRSLAEGGTMDEAIDEFSEVIKHCPDNAMAYYERGVAKLKAGGGKGIYDLNRSLAIDPNLFQAFLTRAAHYGRTGRHSKAILNCNEAIKLVPNSVRAHLCRGALKYHVKLYSGALEDLNTAISLDPSHAALAFFNRALCFEATGNLHKALSDYSTVLLLQESGVYSYKVYVNRGLLYLRLKDFANALLDFLEAKKVWVSGSNGGQEVERKTDPAIHQAIGYCHHQLGSLESAIEAYSLAIDQDPSFLEAYVGRGNVYMDFLSEEGFAKSKEDYVRVLELNASYLPARVNFSFLLQAEGRYKQAWDELTFVLKEDSSFAPALEARSIISLQMDNTFGALLDINNALKLVQSAALLTNRGVIHQFMGDVVNAMRDYQSAVAMEPDYFLAHFNIGNVLFQQRHFRQAITSYTKALSSCQDDAVLLNRAIAYSILQETEKALLDFDLAIELNPYSAPSYFNRGNLHCSLGNHSTAEQDYKKALELQPGDWLTMYYYGEVVGKQRRMDESRDIFRLAAQTEIP